MAVLLLGGDTSTSVIIKFLACSIAVAGLAFYLIRRSRHRGAHHRDGPVVGERRHRQRLIWVPIGVLVLSMINVAENPPEPRKRDDASYAAGWENGSIQGNVYRQATSAPATDSAIRSRCQTSAAIAAEQGRYWKNGYLAPNEVDESAYVDGCFDAYRLLAPG
jgi:hypothetical protein